MDLVAQLFLGWWYYYKFGWLKLSTELKIGLDAENTFTFIRVLNTCQTCIRTNKTKTNYEYNLKTKKKLLIRMRYVCIKSRKVLFSHFVLSPINSVKLCLFSNKKTFPCWCTRAKMKKSSKESLIFLCGFSRPSHWFRVKSPRPPPPLPPNNNLRTTMPAQGVKSNHPLSPYHSFLPLMIRKVVW